MSDLWVAPNVIRLQWAVFFDDNQKPYWDFEGIKSTPMGTGKIPSQWRFSLAYQGWKYTVLVDCFNHFHVDYDLKEIEKRVREVVRLLLKEGLTMHLISLNNGKSKIVRLTMDDFQKLGGFNPMLMEIE